MAIKLNTAEPTIVPVPISLSDINTPITEVNNSGADVPIAMNVAPAMSDGKLRANQIESCQYGAILEHGTINTFTDIFQ